MKKILLVFSVLMMVLSPLSASAYVDFPIRIYGANNSSQPTMLTWQVPVSPGDVVEVTWKASSAYAIGKIVVNNVVSEVPGSDDFVTQQIIMQDPSPTVSIWGNVTTINRWWEIAGVWVNGTDINVLETVKTPPDAPKLTGSLDDGMVHLSWTDERYATSYNIYLNNNRIVQNLGQTSYTYVATENEVLSFAVTAVNHIGESNYSNTYVVLVDTIPPAPPQNVRVTEVGNGFVSLAWNKNNEGDLAGYIVYQDGLKITPIIESTRYTVSGLTNDETYSFYVSAVDTAGNVSEPSAAVEATPHIAPPSTPQNVRTNPGNEYVQIYWAANPEPDITGYNVYRDGILIAERITDRQYLDTGLTNFVTYMYQVQAINSSDLESPLSAAVAGMPENPDVTPPNPPEGLEATAGDREVVLTWDANGEDDLAGYIVYRNGARLNATPITANTYTDINLKNGTTYTYTVRAIDTSGNISDPSEPVTATPELPPNAPPQNVRAQAGNGFVRISWQEKSGAAAYQIYRDGEIIALVTETYFVDEDVENGTTYSYQVSAIVDGIEGELSAPVRATPGEILSFPNGEQGLPGLSSVLGSAWNFLGQFNWIIIFVLAILVVPVLVGFILWLVLRLHDRRKKKEQAEADRILRDERHPARERIIQRVMERQQRIERHFDDALTNAKDRRAYDKKMSAIGRERVRMNREIIREHRRARETREPIYASREERVARTARPERGARRGRE